MQLELVPARKLLVAVGTGVGLVAGVQANVAVPIGLLRKRLRAEHAGRAVVLHEAVRFHLVEGPKGGVANGAGLGSGGNVDAGLRGLRSALALSLALQLLVPITLLQTTRTI